MALFDFLGGDFDFQEPFSRNQVEGQVGESRQRFSDMLNQIVSRGTQLQDEPRLTAQDLFGDQIQRMTDAAGQSANATKQALSRSMIAGGGDTTGAAASNLLDVGAQTNQQIGDLGMRFSRLADRVNRYRNQRGDSLASQGLQGLQNLFQSDKGTLANLIQRQIQREQAQKERGAGVLGGLFNVGSQLGAAAICWVAEELYGEDHQRVVVIRSFLIGHKDADDAIGELYDAYKENGRKWAEQIQTDLPARMAAERLFDELYELAKAA